MENRERPDGSIATGVGWVLVGLGIIAGFVGGGAETLEGMITAFALANLGVGLGVLLLSLGYLVRAIWFLPGRQIPQETASKSTEGSTTCQWCGRDKFPYRACSSASDEVNRDRAPRLQDEVCRLEFHSRGLISEQPGK